MFALTFTTRQPSQPKHIALCRRNSIYLFLSIPILRCALCHKCLVDSPRNSTRFAFLLLRRFSVLFWFRISSVQLCLSRRERESMGHDAVSANGMVDVPFKCGVCVCVCRLSIAIFLFLLFLFNVFRHLNGRSRFTHASTEHTRGRNG